MHGKLVLFDIDGTLIDTGGAGVAALRRAARDLHDGDGPELQMGGATDSGLVREILTHFGVEPTEEHIRAFYEAYLNYLAEHLEGDRFEGILFNGVRELLDRLGEAGAALGLLTGNLSDGAAMKMRHFGLAEYFSFGAFGDDHHDRNELGPIALRRAAQVHGRTFAGRETTIVGDTPKDIACGRAIGAVTLCVTTGSYSAEDLEPLGPDLVVDELRDADGIVRFLSAKTG